MKDCFSRILKEHRVRYPLMEPQDYGKLAFQGEFGAGHFAGSREQALKGILSEMDTLFSDVSALPVDIGGGLCRFPLSACRTKEELQLLADLFLCTAQNSGGTLKGLLQKVDLLRGVGVPGMTGWLAAWEKQGYTAVHHSSIYRDAYHPHYRLLKKGYAACFTALAQIALLSRQEKPAIIAVDGRCGSGKTHLADLVHTLFPCNVVHMDDFYLPPDRRQDNWLQIPGGNMDFERINDEILAPIHSGLEVVYRPFDCGKCRITGQTRLPARSLTIIEGTYSHHPKLRVEYDLKIFLTCEKEEQIRRLKEREGSGYVSFAKRWMPMEEHYFEICGIEGRSSLHIDTSGVL